MNATYWFSVHLLLYKTPGVLSPESVDDMAFSHPSQPSTVGMSHEKSYYSYSYNVQGTIVLEGIFICGKLSEVCDMSRLPDFVILYNCSFRKEKRTNPTIFSQGAPYVNLGLSGSSCVKIWTHSSTQIRTLWLSCNEKGIIIEIK